MGDSESKPQVEEKLGLEFPSASSLSSAPGTDLASHSDADEDPNPDTVETLDEELVVTLNAELVETLDGELQNLGLEEKEKEKEEEVKEEEDEKENENEEDNDKDSVDWDSIVDEEKNRRFELHPQRPDQPDCPFFLRTGTCKFGRNCKFNHPPKRRNKARSSDSQSPEPDQKDGKEKGKEEFPERAGQSECKYYLRTGGCKFGKACRYNHTREKTVVEAPLDYNFLGLPIRPGEKECPYYMRTGSCKYATNCRFHHPDPSAVGGCVPQTGYDDGGSVPLQSSGTLQPAVTTWSSPRTSNETIPYLDATSSFVPVVLPPPQGSHPNSDWNGHQGGHPNSDWNGPQGGHPNSDWNGYQAPVYQPERSVHPPSTLALNNPIKKADGSTQHQHQMVVEEFPERPGQPVCTYFMKNGDCKFRSGCKYHHPKNRAPKSPMLTLSPMGLPLRPDQNVCTHYSRYGICKFGPACRFNHPINYGSSPIQPPSFGDSGTWEGVEHGSDVLTQQSV